MTPEDFIEWIDKEIQKAQRWADRESSKMEPDQSFNGRLSALEEVKQKFFTLTPPPTTLS